MSNNDYTLTLILLAIIGGPSAAIGGAIGMALPGWSFLILAGLVLYIGLVALVMYAKEKWDENPARIARLAARPSYSDQWREKLPTYVPDPEESWMLPQPSPGGPSSNADRAN